MTTLLHWLAPVLNEDNTAPAQRYQTDGVWVSRSYSQLYDLVRRTADVLIANGAGPTRPVAIIASTSPEWTILDLAAALIGAPSVPVYPTSSPHQVAEILARVKPAVTVTDRSDLVETPWTGILKRIPEAGRGLGDLARDPLGPAENRAVDAKSAGVDSGDTYSVIFSSGSTGAPKGCILSHENYVSVLRMVCDVEGGGPNGGSHRQHAFVYLPLAHVSARLQQLTTLSFGGELIYGHGTTSEILVQIGEARPSYVPGVPRFFESAYLRAHRDPGRLRALFGDQLHYALTGGAPIDPDMLHTYRAAGITLVEGYGLTETAAALTLGAPHSNRAGSVGKALPGVSLKLGDDGELLARGANVFSRYLDDHASTSEAFDDGWFRTGDLANIDADGFVRITGRKKNLIVTSTGKNIAPEPTENRLRSVLGIDDVALVGDGRPFLIALLFGVNADEAARLVAGTRAINAELAPPERIRKVVLLPDPLDPALGEVTPSGKLVRQVVLERHRALLDDVYQRRGPLERVIEIIAAPAASRAA
ncbi:MAG: AMP-dependent synthetase/ligase [Pseudoclavibacter sp.]